MFNFQDFTTEVFAGVVIALLTTMVLFLWKLPQTLKELRTFMRSMSHRMDLAESRMDVYDHLWSRHFETIVRSDLIANGSMEYPENKHGKRHS